MDAHSYSLRSRKSENDEAEEENEDENNNNNNNYHGKHRQNPASPRAHPFYSQSQSEDFTFDAGIVLHNARTTVKNVADFTAPGLSWFFVAFIIVGAYFHEAYFFETSIVIGAWFVLQLIGTGLDEEFHQNLFWGFVRAISSLAGYILVGYLWTFPKLFIDVALHHLDAANMAKLNKCEDFAAFLDFYLSIKWLLTKWILTWPMSMIYTASRDPLHLATEFLLKWSQSRYIYILQSALRYSRNENTEDVAILWFVGAIVVYLFLGYLITHIKLFLDVWQGTLPPKFDEKVRAVYRGEDSYLGFVIEIKWLIMQWMITWPVSLLYTFLRHPIRFVVESLYNLSQRKYVWITKTAMRWREENKEQ